MEKHLKMSLVLLIMAGIVAGTRGLELLLICHEMNTIIHSDNVTILEGIDFVVQCQELLNITGLNSSLSGTWLELHNNTNMSVVSDGGLHSNEVLPWRITFDRVQHFITGIYFPALAILGMIGNVIILSVLRKNVLQSTSNIYLVGIAIYDLVFVINYFPTTFTVFEATRTNLIYQTFRAIHRSYVYPLVSICHTATTWVIIAFTVERYLAVALPLKAQKYCTRTRAKLAVIGAFVFSFVLNFIRFFRNYPIAKTDPITNQTFFTLGVTDIGLNDEVASWIFWSYLIVAEVVPFIILICLNSAIIFKLWQARQKRLNMTGENGLNEKSRETQITRMLISIVIAFLVCNSAAAGGSLWVAVNGVRAAYTTQDAAVYYMFAIGHALYITNPMTNCILYAACSSDMRKGIKSQLCIGGHTKDTSKYTASIKSNIGQYENRQL